MRVFVINLLKNTERMDLIRSRLGQLNVPLERVPAIYGKELADDDRKRMASRFKWKCLKGYSIRDGELGCALSHREAYRRLLECDESCCCVLEDDAKIYDAFAERLEGVQQWIKRDRPQVVLLSDHTGKKSVGESIERVQSASFADGYVITRAAAAALYDDNFPVNVPADSWTHWIRKGILEVYQARPGVCDQQWTDEGYVSDITTGHESMVDVRRMSVSGKIMWKMKRAIGILIAKVMGWE